MHVRFFTVEDASRLAAYERSPNLPPLQVEKLAQDRPDAHIALLDEQECIRAHCSLWWRDVPDYPGHRPGVLGHYGATDFKAAQALLWQAEQALARQGCTLAVGPMDGNTWRPYRFITGRGDTPRFFLEQDHPDDWPRHLETCGYRPLARYYSAMAETADPWDTKTDAAFQRLSGSGVTFRPIDMSRFEAELQRVYAVSRVGFRNNFLYTPITEAEFTARYLPIAPCIRPELTLMAECGGQLAGFLFTVPDALQAQRGESVDTLIFKTVARLPDAAYLGLGRVLMDMTQRSALEYGYRRVIHAYMHEDNASLALSRRTSRIIRQYALFAKALAP